MKAILVSVIFLLFSSLSIAAELPPDFVAKYKITKGFVTIGKAKRSLSTNGTQKVYVSDSRTTGFIGSLFKEKIIQKTEFAFEDSMLKPLKYYYDRNNGKKKVEQTYDWKKGWVHSQRDDKLSEYEIPTGSQDQSSYQLALMLDLADGKRNFSYQIAENVRLVNYELKHLGNKKLKTIYGKLDTVVIQVKTKKMKTTIWSAPSLHYLPVKIEHEEKGTSFYAHLESVQGISPATL